MGLRVPDRVHIMPVGYEVSRVLESADRYKADQVVLIAHEKNDERGSNCLSQVRKGLSERGLDSEPVRCDIFDLYDSLRTIASLTNKFEEDEVFINVATGSKVTAIAGMIASMVQDATAYYVQAEDYTGDTPKGIEAAFELPHYPINPPNLEEVALLKLIKRLNDSNDPPTKGELIFWSEQNDLPYIKRNVDGKGKYRLLDNNIITPLQERGHITVEKSGRNKVVKITDRGEDAVRAFDYLVEREEFNWDPWSDAEQGSVES